jgi:hypothetical protein
MGRAGKPQELKPESVVAPLMSGLKPGPSSETTAMTLKSNGDFFRSNGKSGRKQVPRFARNDDFQEKLS